MSGWLPKINGNILKVSSHQMILRCNFQKKQRSLEGLILHTKRSWSQQTILQMSYITAVKLMVAQDLLIWKTSQLILINAKRVWLIILKLSSKHSQDSISFLMMIYFRFLVLQAQPLFNHILSVCSIIVNVLYLVKEINKFLVWFQMKVKNIHSNNQLSQKEVLKTGWQKLI